LTSHSLASWNFGTLPQRMSLGSWSAILGFWNNIIAHWSVLLVCALAVCLAKKYRLAYFACAGLATSAPLIFFNLHAVHEYYPYANGLLLVGAVGIAVAALLERGQGYRWAAGGVFMLFALASVFRYGSGFYPRLAHDQGGRELRAIARSVKELTEPGDVLLVVGSDWSPAIPFYCERRALMVPADRQWAAEALAAYRRWFGQEAAGRTDSAPSDARFRRVGALVVVEPPESGLDVRSLRALLAAFGLDQRGRRIAGHCLLFTRIADHNGAA
jgi:hypothetical protein